MRESENKIDPEYVLWFFDVMLWLDALDEDSLGAIGAVATRAWINSGES